MSYNIDDVKIVSGKLVFPVTAFKAMRKFARDHDYKLPEGCFLTQYEGNYDEDADENFEFSPDDEDEGTIGWHGGKSGSAYHDGLFKEIIALSVGTADLVIIWEGGDSTTGLRVKDGKVKEVKVKQQLVEDDDA